MSDPEYDTAIENLARLLINDLIKEAADSDAPGSPRDKIRWALKHTAGEKTLAGISALTAYAGLQFQERQTAALESIAKTLRTQSNESPAPAQAIIDQREPKRDSLATEYSLSPERLTFIWAVRGMVMDAAVKSLSRPDRFDVYEHVSTDEIAWSLRITKNDVWRLLPRKETAGGQEIDYNVLEAFDIIHYGGTMTEPDDWAYAG